MSSAQAHCWAGFSVNAVESVLVDGECPLCKSCQGKMHKASNFDADIKCMWLGVAPLCHLIDQEIEAMNDFHCNLLAVNVVAYIEDDVCVVSFASDMSPDPERYLILSESLWPASEDSHSMDCFEILHAGIAEKLPTMVRLVELSPGKLTIYFGDAHASRTVEVVFPLSYFDLLCEFMPRIVEKTAVPLKMK